MRIWEHGAGNDHKRLLPITPPARSTRPGAVDASRREPAQHQLVGQINTHELLGLQQGLGVADQLLHFFV